MLLHGVQHEQRLGRHADVDDRLLRAGAEAADGSEVHGFAGALDGVGKRVIQTLRAIAATARPHPDGDARYRSNQLSEADLANLVKCADFFDPGHYSLSRARARNSRCKLRSFTWLQMRWLI